MPDSVWSVFGPWLQSERRRAKASQRAVAKAAELDVVHLSRIENGHSGTKRETLIIIVDAINRTSTTGYQVNLDEALRRSGYASTDPVEMYNVMDKARLAFLDSSFSEDEKGRIVDMMKVLIAGALAGKDQEKKK